MGEIPAWEVPTEGSIGGAPITGERDGFQCNVGGSRKIMESFRLEKVSKTINSSLFHSPEWKR